jgi:hypothetical protein
VLGKCITDASITEVDARFELHVATRSIHVAIVTMKPRGTTSSFATKFNKSFVQFVTKSSRLLKFVQIVEYVWGNITATFANSMMMIPRNNNFIVINVGSAELAAVKIIFTARNVVVAL